MKPNLREPAHRVPPRAPVRSQSIARKCLISVASVVGLSLGAEWGINLTDAQVPGGAGKTVPLSTKTDSVSVTLNGKDQYAYYEGKVVSSYPFTLAAWIKTSSADTQSPVGIYDSTNDTRFWRIRFIQGEPRMEASNPSLQSSAAGSRYNDGRWHFMVAVFAGSQRREFFIDGVSKAVSTASVNFSTNGAVFMVGRSGGPQSGEYFRGRINEVAVWKAALSAAAIQALYNSGKPAVLTMNLGSYTAANLSSWWKMGDSGTDNFALHIKDVRGEKHLKPYNLNSSETPSGDVP